MFNPETDLWKLRMEIHVGTLFVRDYENSFCFTAESVCDFFDGYCEHLFEIAKEETGNPYVDWDFVFDNYDNEENLINWYYCFADGCPFEIDEEAATYWDGEEEVA